MRGALIVAALLLAGLGPVASCGGNVDLGGTACPSCAANEAGEAGEAEADAPSDTDCSHYAAPSVSAKCEACSHGSKGCQDNGCYNGFYCYLSTRDCRPAPASCGPSGDDAPSD